MKKYTFFAVFLCLIFSVFANGQTPNWKEFDNFVNKTLSDWDLPGAAVAVVKDNQIIYSKGYGVKEYSRSPIMTYKKLYDAVQRKDFEAIFNEFSAETQKFAKVSAKMGEIPLENVCENGFTASTTLSAHPFTKNLVVRENYAVIEVGSDANNSNNWETIPFVFENGNWKLAFGEKFANTFPSIPRPEKEVFYELPLVDPNTVFAISANTKSFTSTAIAMLADEGKLSWDDKVIKFLPDFRLFDKNRTKELTIRDLLSHKTGLPPYSGDIAWWGTNTTREDIVKRIRYIKPQTGMPATYNYQNIAYIVAGEIIKKVSGQTWDEFVTNRIIKPLKMKNTFTSIDNFPVVLNKTTPHYRSLNGSISPIDWRNLNNGAAAVGLNSSATDMANWLIFQMNNGEFEGNPLVSTLQLNETKTSQTVIPFTNPAEPMLKSNFRSYGLGWYLRDYAGRKMVWNNGWADGQLSFSAILPDEKIGVVVLTNLHNRDAYRPIAYHALDVVLNNYEDKAGFDKFTSHLEATKQKRIELAQAKQTEEVAALDKQIAVMEINSGQYFKNWNKYFWSVSTESENELVSNEKRYVAQKENTEEVKNILPKVVGTYKNDIYGKIEIKNENGKLLVYLTNSPTYVGELEDWGNFKFRINWRDLVGEKTWLQLVVNDTKSRVKSIKMTMSNFIDETEYEYKRNRWQ